MDEGVVELARHKLDVDAYYKMYEAGVFGERARIELIDGEVIDMAPIGQEHVATVNSLNRELVRASGDHAIVSVQNPVRLDRLNEPEPDFVLFRPRADNYRTGERPGPADVLLVVEVSNSSLRFDKDVKLPLCARTGVPEVWIVDLAGRKLDAFRNPSAGRYTEVQTYAPGESVALALAPEIRLALTRVFD